MTSHEDEIIVADPPERERLGIPIGADLCSHEGALILKHYLELFWERKDPGIKFEVVLNNPGDRKKGARSPDTRPLYAIRSNLIRGLPP